MATICSVDGCDKQAQQGKDGMCCTHWRKTTGTPIKKMSANKKTITAPGSDKREREPLPEPPAGGRGRLLGMLTDNTVRPGFFLDFTGREELFASIGPVSAELNGEILDLLAMVMEGKLGMKAVHP